MTSTVRQFITGSGSQGSYYSLPALKEAGVAPNLDRLPTSIRIVLESVVRNCDGKKVTEKDVTNLANWNAKAPGDYEIPFVVARIVLQDFTGVPLLVDLAAMRSAVHRMGKNPKMIEPLVPVDLVVDHSVQVDYAGTGDSLARNLDLEFHRNRERYQFLKWGEQAFDTFKVVPPGIGIVHQVNLEYLAKGVLEKGGVYYPDSLVGTDSHTTMINGLGVVGWGVGGIEAEAGMLGQPVTFLVPEVVGVNLTGALQPGVTATDLVLRVTELLRKTKVVGKFVEFYGPGAKALSVPDRATIANMAPEYGATMGFFGIDEATITYLKGTGRSAELCGTVENYYKAQGMWGIPQSGEIDYTQVVELDLSTVKPGLAGPKRPQDRIDLDALKPKWNEILTKAAPDGYGKKPIAGAPEGLDEIPDAPTGLESLGGGAGAVVENPPHEGGWPAWDVKVDSKGGIPDTITHGSVLIAAITSCTNTSNPSVMLAAGLLAKKANARGLKVNPSVKTSLGPGSRVVTDYLNKTGLQVELDKLGFQTVGYGCTTCIGNSGPLDAGIEDVVKKEDVVAASVLSGNRNFEARVHQSIKANFLMSPPLVVAFAIAGTVDVDLSTEPVGFDDNEQPVMLAEIWPSSEEIGAAMSSALSPDVFRKLYTDFAEQNPKWNEIPGSVGHVYEWDQASTYIQEPPFFDKFNLTPGDIHEVKGARPLGIFGDSVTTDHISPAGSIKKDSPAGKFLTDNGVTTADFNSYGSRRGNDRIMTRGTFANVRIKNLMLGGKEGGNTLLQPGGEEVSIYDAAQKYQAAGTPTIVIGGEDYGMGSSRDWAAKGTNLLGVKAVITKSFERIHRSNLVGMGILPCNFKDKADYDKVKDLADATFDLLGVSNDIKPMGEATLRVHKADGSTFDVPVIVRVDTPIEIDYYRAGGILPYVLAQILRERGGLADYGLLTLCTDPPMDSLLLIVRWVLAGIIGLFAVLMAIQAWKDRKPELLVNVCVGGLILLLVCVAGWLILLRWELLAVAGAAVLLAAVAVLAGRRRSQSGTLKAIQELSKKTRPEPMTLEEAKERLALGEELTIMAAFHEQRLGRAMTREELVSYVAEQRENLAEYERQQKLEAEQDELKEQKEEEEAAALIKEMQTGPAGERKLSITLRKKLTVTGIKGQTLPLPSGSQDLWLKMKAEGTEEESEGYPVIRTEIKNAAGDSVTIRVDLGSLIDLTEVQEAVGWRSRPEDWRQSFCRSVLLEATGATSDSRSWVEFPVDDWKIAFYSKYCALVITLACPEAGGIWCRVHGLSHLDPDDNDENDFKPQPPFCFPLKVEALLLFEGEDEEE